ncbi:hypothetical protein D3C71_2118740 [compost metagenome]
MLNTTSDALRTTITNLESREQQSSAALTQAQAEIEALHFQVSEQASRHTA